MKAQIRPSQWDLLSVKLTGALLGELLSHWKVDLELDLSLLASIKFFFLRKVGALERCTTGYRWFESWLCALNHTFGGCHGCWQRLGWFQCFSCSDMNVIFSMSDQGFLTTATIIHFHVTCEIPCHARFLQFTKIFTEKILQSILFVHQTPFESIVNPPINLFHFSSTISR